MPEKKISQMSGMPVHQLRSPYDHNPHTTACCGMSDHDIREFMKEEQKEGMHPSLKGKRF